MNKESTESRVTRRSVLFAGVGAGAALIGIPRKVRAARVRRTLIVGPLGNSVAKGPLVWDTHALGYRSDEYLLSGHADVLEPVSMADAQSIFTRDSTKDFAVRDFATQLRIANLPYTTRLVIYRPLDPRRFSGNVIVETLHPAGGGRGEVWNAVHSFFTERGDAYVGVQHPLTFPALRAADPGRYGALASGDPTQLWGMLADAGAVLKRGNVGSPLHGYAVKHLLMTGYSFTGVATATFANYHHASAKMPDGSNIFDAYLPMADAQYVRPLDVPVMRLDTQSDYNGFGGLQNRRPDDDRYRHYEVAGACHVAIPSPHHAARPPRIASLPTPAGQPKFSLHGCEKQIPPGGKVSDFPLYLFQAGMFENMYAWLHGAKMPPPSCYIETTPAGATKVDQWGNALGGVRYPQVAVPIARYGVDAGRECELFGYTVPFEAALCRRLYGSMGHYLDLVRQYGDQLERERLVGTGGAARLAAIAHAAAHF